MSAPICSVCFTSSWQPCEEDAPEAVKDDSTGGWMVCECCRLGTLLSEANLEIKYQSQVIGSRPNMAWFDVLLQIVNLPSGEKRDKFIELVKQSADVSAEFISPELSPAAKYYGIIQEVVETLAKDGRFDRTIVAIRDELGSDLDRYTSLEWHLWAEEKPEERMSVLLIKNSGYIHSFMLWQSFYNESQSDCVKWAYLPDTGWNME